MLDAHHRAVYRVHSAMQSEVGNRRMYYAVRKTGEQQFEVHAVKGNSNAKRSALPNIEGAKYFTARGFDIKQLVSSMGSYSGDYEVCRVTVLPQPAIPARLHAQAA